MCIGVRHKYSEYNARTQHMVHSRAPVDFRVPHKSAAPASQTAAPPPLLAHPRRSFIRAATKVINSDSDPSRSWMDRRRRSGEQGEITQNIGTGASGGFERDEGRGITAAAVHGEKPRSGWAAAGWRRQLRRRRGFEKQKASETGYFSDNSENGRRAEQPQAAAAAAAKSDWQRG